MIILKLCLKNNNCFYDEDCSYEDVCRFETYEEVYEEILRVEDYFDNKYAGKRAGALTTNYEKIIYIII